MLFTEPLVPMIGNISVNETLPDRITVVWPLINGDVNATISVSWKMDDKGDHHENVTAGSLNLTILNLEACAVYRICLSTVLGEMGDNCVEAKTGETSEFFAKPESHTFL